MNRNYAIVLAGGSGSRMKSDVPKQFIEIDGKPLIWYSLNAFEKCDFIDDIILVTRTQDVDNCYDNIIKKYKLTKVTSVVTGGALRCDSVMNGLKAVREKGFVFIHDGARPCITDVILENLYKDVKKYGTAIAAVPSKDTVKIADDDGFVRKTPDRKNTWIVQTPQAFDSELIKTAYSRIDNVARNTVTDDAMVMENYGDKAVRLTMSQYTNIKVTTPDDLVTVTGFLKKFKNQVDISK